MDLAKVKLVVSDMDGTLLNSNHEVSTLFFELFLKMKAHNILFVAASGRPHYSICDKLSSIKDQIYIVSENGGFISYKEKMLLSTPLVKEDVTKFANLIDGLDNTHPVFCGHTKAYIKNNSDVLLKLLSEYYPNYKIIDNISEIDEPIYKVAIYHEDSSEKYVYPHVKHLESDFKVKTSATHWVDISHNLANKGHAIRFLQNLHNISVDETMAFGDYNNDLEMLERAHYSYAMKNAHPNVKDVARFETENNDAYGVEIILEKLVRAK
ncbi:HAD family hydrolase [uncultured Algibacter sp.]|uniref:HAD family hydrolase n=1 Tax=uncultured Algibacter sp. TaxID=298659 RepID=UPI003217F2C0